MLNDLLYLIREYEDIYGFVTLLKNQRDGTRTKKTSFNTIVRSRRFVNDAPT